MAQRTLSSKKRNRQEKMRYQRNQARKRVYKSVKRLIKKSFIPSSASNKHEKAGTEKLAELMKQFQKALDKAAKRGVIHKNKSAREKARMQALFARSQKQENITHGKSSKGTAKAKARKVVKKKVSSRRKK